MDIKKVVNAVLWGGFFIVAGILLLLDTLGIVSVNFSQWWPVVLIFIGLSIIADGLIKGSGHK